MNSYVKLMVDRLTDEAVAAEVGIRMESAVHLARLAWQDPQTVYVVGCARDIDPWGEVGGYIVRPREERTLARPDERVTLIAAAGISREEALIRLEHIWAHLVGLPRGTVLVTDAPSLDRPTNVLARLDTTRAIILREIEAGTDFLS